MVTQDLRYALRTLFKNSGFTAVAAAALALGIGANTAIFSVVNTVLLRPLPYRDPDRLVWLWGQDPRRGVPTHLILYPDYVEWSRQSRTLESASAYAPEPMTITAPDGGAEPERVNAMRVNASFLRVLGVKPAIGRDFTDDDDRPGARKVALISHALWQRRFGSDRQVSGKPILLDGPEYTIAGVLPQGFRAMTAQQDVYTPFALPPAGPASAGVTVGAHARLKPGVTLAQARAETATIVPRLNQRFFGTSGRSLKLWGAREFMVRDVRRSLLVLMGAVVLVLLIACANVANLLLARAGARQREMAIRAALGAGRWRIVRQLLTESAVLGLGSGLVGLAAAYWGVQALIAAVPERYPLLHDTRLDWTVLAFTLGVSLATAVLFGLAPALSISRGDVHRSLKEGGRTGIESGSRNRLRQALVVSEVALALVLAIGAGLLIKAFGKLLDVHPGFTAHHLLTASVTLPQSRYKPPDRLVFFRRLLEQVSGVPGVQAAGLVSVLPISGGNTGRNIAIEGRPEGRPEDQLIIWYRAATPGYFRAMEIPLRRGRLPGEQDITGAPLVAVINETAARRYFPNQDPVGRRVNWGRPGPGHPEPPWITVVGVIGDVRHTTLAQTPAPEIFMAYEQQPLPGMTLAVRTAVEPSSIAPALRSAANSIDRNVALSRVRNMEQTLSESLAERRLAAWLLGVFAGLAVLLAAVGIYGVISFSVARRTHEIGVRLALGADAGAVLRLILGQAMRLAGAGLAVGVAAAFATTRLMRSILYEVTATDPLVFGGFALVLAAVAAVASFIPARRATKVQPVTALRYE